MNRQAFCRCILRWKKSALAFGLIVAMIMLREAGIVDFHWYRSRTETSRTLFPNHTLGRHKGKVAKVKIYLVDEGKMHTDANRDNPIREICPSDAGSLVELFITDYYSATDLTLYVPLWKSGTHRAYFYWESTVDRQNTNFGLSSYVRKSRILGLCSAHHLRQNAFDEMIDGIVEGIRKEAADRSR